MHKDDKAVSEAMRKSGKAQLIHFRQLKREGIKKMNEFQLAVKQPIARERSSKDDKEPVVCASCGAVISRTYFWRHRRECITHKPEAIPTPVPVRLTVGTEQSRLKLDFRRDVLRRLRNDAIGRLCMEDETLSMIGLKLYQKVQGRPNKKVLIRKNVLANMRLLARLFTNFKKLSCENVEFTDMFTRAHYETFESAIQETTMTETKGLLSGTKMMMSSLIDNACRYVNAHFLFMRNEDAAAEVTKFQAILKSNYNEVFGDAKHHQNHRRQVRLRRPAALPADKDLLRLKVSVDTKHFCLQLLPHDAVHKHGVCCPVVSVQFFLLSGSYTISGFPYETLWQYTHGNLA